MGSPMKFGRSSALSLFTIALMGLAPHLVAQAQTGRTELQMHSDRLMKQMDSLLPEIKKCGNDGKIQQALTMTNQLLSELESFTAAVVKTQALTGFPADVAAAANSGNGRYLLDWLSRKLAENPQEFESLENLRSVVNIDKNLQTMKQALTKAASKTPSPVPEPAAATSEPAPPTPQPAPATPEPASVTPKPDAQK
jgi:hypothetical protein